MIRQQNKELMGILENIINLSKLEARSMSYSPVKGSVNDLFKKIHAQFIHECEHNHNKKIEIKCINEQPDLYFHTDFILLKHIMDSLMDNACKFTQTGLIEFGCKQYDANTILFWVKDTGIGISDEELSIIFSRFRQADDSKTRKYGGNGIGLTISKACVELLGGKIWVESEKGKGSVFYFTVPIERL